MVELTIALHYVYDAPRDKIVWDVGHQAYPHKLLTGRRALFPTIRTFGGLSGFPKRAESPFDPFGAGHASTAISSALGMALARDHQGGDHRIVAICGDGAMTGGLCYEALNNLGYLSPDMLIILNDNEMSISPNIGAMSHYFNQILTTNFYNKSKKTAKDLIKRTLGERAVNLSHRIQTSLKDLIVAEETIFEKMGIRYLGPVDGHDLPDLVGVLEHVKNLKGPVLLHVKTVKGKGYTYSESDPEKWHSGADFEVSTGEKMAAGSDAPPPKSAPPTYTEVFGRTLVELAEEDDRIVAITAAMPSGTGLSVFAERFPDRFHDVGIAEGHAVCCAAGMACENIRPVVAIYSTFLQRAFDQLLHDVALQNLPVTFAIDRAGLVGEDGPTHHGVFDLSYLRMIPGLVVMAPRDEAQLRDMMLTASKYEEGPVAYRYPRARGRGVDISAPPEQIEIGTGEILREPDKNVHRSVAILTIGSMAHNALEAARILEEQDLGVAVADMRFLKPLDRKLILELARDYDQLVTVEENVLAGGFGSGVIEVLASRGVLKPVTTLGLPDAWIEQGSIDDLLDLHGLTPRGIAEAILAKLPVQTGAQNLTGTG